MNFQEILDYYSRKEIAGEIAKGASGREVAGAFFNGAYDKRPNVIQFPSDVIQTAKARTVSFHYSVEHWSNAMALTKKEEDYARLRTGWDLLIDIDSKIGLEESQITASMICEFLEKKGIKNYGVKFSGRRGFHIILPWKMFPKEINYEKTETRYPQVPRIISSYIREMIKEDLMLALVKQKGAKALLDVLDSPPSEMSPYYFVEVEKNWGNRHMFRAPYSLNEKTWLVSVPIEKDELKTFSIAQAKPENVKIKDFFKGEENEAERLVVEALDWHASTQKEERRPTVKKIVNYERKIGEDIFPPCIKIILGGLRDGRKRSLFTLINFLRMCNWQWQEIDTKIHEWNSRNAPPLPESMLLSQLRWAQQNARNVANCDNAQFFLDLGLCHPDAVCKGGTDKITIKNPINYPFRLMKKEKKAAKAAPRKRGFSCGVCNSEFETMNGLALHKGRMHSGYE